MLKTVTFNPFGQKQSTEEIHLYYHNRNKFYCKISFSLQIVSSTDSSGLNNDYINRCSFHLFFLTFDSWISAFSDTLFLYLTPSASCLAICCLEKRNSMMIINVWKNEINLHKLQILHKKEYIQQSLNCLNRHVLHTWLFADNSLSLNRMVHKEDKSSHWYKIQLLLLHQLCHSLRTVSHSILACTALELKQLIW